MRIILLFLFASHHLEASGSKIIETIKLLKKCKSAHCVEMDVNWGKTKPDFKTTTSSESNFKIFSFNSKGRLNNQEVSTYPLEIEGYTDGIECNDFGQAKVAVLGIKNGNPILETSLGKLELMDSSLKVGCTDCLQILDEKTQKVISKHLSPGWDLSLTGHSLEDFSYDESNQVYIKKFNKCLKIPRNGFFKEFDGKCHKLENVGDYQKPYKKFPSKPAEWYYKLKPSNTVLLIKSGACT